MQKIGVLDCNNFFVSCERLFRPDLMNRPVVVLSGNDGCVVARSKEVKDKGIPMGVPYFQVKDTLTEIKATAFSSNFALYRDISKRVFEVVKSEIGAIEQYSIDECFFTVDSDNIELIKLVKTKVEKQVGIPVSIGLADSKTQAKYVNTLAKKTNEVVVFDNERWQSEASVVRLSEIWGVGVNRSRTFAKHDISTVSDLCSVPEFVVKNLFGIEGLRLQAELLGKAVLPVKSLASPQKSVSSSRSFAETTNNLFTLEDAILFHIYQATKNLEMMDLSTSSLRIAIYPSRFGDYLLQGSSLEVSFATPTRDLFQLNREAKKLLKSCYKAGVPYKKVGVSMTNLTASAQKTNCLFTTETKISSEVSQVLFAINSFHKKPLLQLGRIEKKIRNWDTKKTKLSPAYTTKWTALKKVKA